MAKKPRVSAPPPEAKTSNPKPKKKTPLQKLVDNSSSYAGPPRTQEEDKEDAYIRYLEGRLGWKKNGIKTSAYGSGSADDGLGGMYVSFLAILTSPNWIFHLQSYLPTWIPSSRQLCVKGSVKPSIH